MQFAYPSLFADYWHAPEFLKKILLPSAVHLEERLTVSQSVPEPASRQSDGYTQFGFFVSSRYGPKQQGDPSLESREWPSGNAAARRSCGRRFKPHSAHFGAAAGGGAKIRQIGIRTHACTAVNRLRYHWTADRVISAERPHCL